MKFWKLALVALIGGFTLNSSACVITSDDDDDNIGDDDDYGDDDDDGDSGTGGNGNYAGNGNTGGNTGISGAGGSGGAPTGTVSQYFGDPGDACRQCLDTMTGLASEGMTDCETVVDNCGPGGQNCLTFVGCLSDEQQEFDASSPPDSDDSLTCSLVACGSGIAVSPNPAEEQDFYTCLVDKCATACRFDNPLPLENDPGIENRCPNMINLSRTVYCICHFKKRVGQGWWCPPTQPPKRRAAARPPFAFLTL